MQDAAADVKMYSDYKSPYAYLGFDPGFALEQKYKVRVRWRPFNLEITRVSERSEQAARKIKYSYLDVRRWANLRGGLVIKGPLKIYDSTPALIGGLFADRHGALIPYSRQVFERFFRRELEIDQPDAVAGLIASLGLAQQGYRDYLGGEGARDLEAVQQEAAADNVFGVPMFIFKGEPFWGHDRIELLEHRLAAAGLSWDGATTPSAAVGA